MDLLVAYIEQYLQNEEIDTDFVQVDEDTRINIKLKTGQESEINALGPNISEQNFAHLKQKIQQLGSRRFISISWKYPC